MNKTIIKIKVFLLSLFVAGNMIAQEKLTKVSQSINVDKEVSIDLNTSYCNIVFDTWNKNTVEVEAYIEGDDLSKEDLESVLDSWNVDIDGSTKKVSISTKGNAPHTWTYSYSHGDDDVVHAVLNELKYELADLPEIIGESLGFSFEMPELPEVPEAPELPEMPELPELPELPENVSSFTFDYNAYKKDGEKYLEEYTKKFESTYGEDYAKKMEVWGEKFGKEWSEKFGKQMEEWAKKFEGQWNSEEFEQKIEAWGERFAAQMERDVARTEAEQKRLEKIHKRVEEEHKRIEKMHETREKVHEKLAKEREKHAEKREELANKRKVLIERLVDKKSHSKVKKTIKIKMPKGAKLKVNVRHGEIEFAANVDNIKADLSHAKFIAKSVNGGSTSINASYSPIYVTNWNLGELNLKYVKSAELNNVKNMVLTSNSSNVTINNLLGSAIIDSNIGDLKIIKIDDAFNNLNVIVQNCDALIALPKVECNLQYKGDRSRIVHPQKEDSNITSFSTGNLSSGKSIVLNAKYSNVVMK